MGLAQARPSYGTGRGRYASLTYRMISEIIKLFHQNLFENVQVGDQNVGICVSIVTKVIVAV